MMSMINAHNILTGNVEGRHHAGDPGDNNKIIWYKDGKCTGLAQDRFQCEHCRPHEPLDFAKGRNLEIILCRIIQAHCCKVYHTAVEGF
jgi:hypothetical protein